MSKRFTCTDKWERPWFRDLPSKYKLLWFYILDKCDIAGVWYIDLKLASFMIGEKFDSEDLIKYLGKQIEVKFDRLLVLDFIKFQYGNLTEKNKMYNPVNQKLSSFKDPAYIPYNSPINGVKDKDKDKEKEKDNEFNVFCDHVFSEWNKMAAAVPSFPKLVSLSKSRIDHLRARYNQPTFRDIEKVLYALTRLPFYRGENDRKWVATFDYIIENDNNHIKILEKYQGDK